MGDGNGAVCGAEMRVNRLADGDGAVNINDATVIQLHLAEKLTLDEAAGYAADIDRNGELNINDASLIQRYLARLSTEFEVNTMR